MKTFLTIAILLALAIVLAAAAAFALSQPFWLSLLAGLVAAPAAICTIEALGEIWELEPLEV
jgi:membrane protein YdbS with pleckstrin-like domain